MIYKFRIVSDEVDDFRRDILIDSEATFLELRDIICESIDFDPNQMSSFFICDSNWEKTKEITLEDMGSDFINDIFLMEDTHLSDMIDEEGQKLLFTFDYITDRSLFLQLKETEPGQNLLNAECVFLRGTAPRQTIDWKEFENQIDEKNASSATSLDLDEDFLGSNDYNDDDLQGFDQIEEAD